MFSCAHDGWIVNHSEAYLITSQVSLGTWGNWESLDSFHANIAIIKIRGAYQFAIFAGINGTSGRTATIGRIGIIVEICVVDGGVEKKLWSDNGELEEAAAMEERIAAFSRVSSDWVSFCCSVSKFKSTEFSWLSPLLWLLEIKLGFSKIAGSFGSGFDLV